MANKAISELPQAQNVNNQDLFVLEQSGIAKKLTAETFITEQGIIDALTEALDGHGGIQSVTLSSVSGRIRTYRITFSDGSATTFQVYDGTSIDRISRTSSSGLDDVYTVFLSDGTTTFFTVHNGADGDVSEAMLNNALKGKAPVITETTESSAIANFTDGADDMPLHNILAEINPVQDLTYGDPYPAGGGKQLIPYPYYDSRTSIANVAVTYNSDGSITLNGTASGSLFVNLGNGNPAANTITLDAGAYTLSKTGVSGLSLTAVKNGNYWFTSTATSDATQTLSEQSTVYFYLSAPSGTVFNNAVVYPQCEKGSTATAYAPYSNICPITGWTGCNVTRAGKNLLSTNGLTLGTPSSTTFSNATKRTFTIGTYVTGLSVGNYYQVKTSSISVSDNNISFTTSATAYGIAIPLVGFPVGEKITISATKTKGNVGFSFYKQDGTYISGDRSTPNNNYYTVVIPTETYYTIAIFDAQSNNVESTFTNIMIEVGTASAYEPYIAPATASLSWQDEAGTVYGGTIDVATGLLTVDYALVTINGTNYPIGATPSAASGTALVQVILPDIALVDQYDSSKVVSDYLPSTTDYSIYRNASPAVAIHPATPAQNRRLWLRLPNITTEADAKTYLANNPLTVVYPLATPQTYQLTPQEVLHTLYGVNNVWADTGNVSVTYTADTKMYIQNLTQPTEDDLVANQAITSGKYFMIGNSLYLALANIASGAQITIGTNAQRVSLADALNTINS